MATVKQSNKVSDHLQFQDRLYFAMQRVSLSRIASGGSIGNYDRPLTDLLREEVVTAATVERHQFLPAALHTPQSL